MACKVYKRFKGSKVKLSLWIILQDSKRHLSTENYHSNIKWWLSKTFSQTSFVSWGWLMKKQWDKEGERAASGRSGRRTRKPPCGWQQILLPKNFPFSKHFTYHYVNLIVHRGWVKVLRRNAVQCVYVLRFSLIKVKHIIPSTKPPFLLSLNRPFWQPPSTTAKLEPSGSPWSTEASAALNTEYVIQLTLANTGTTSNAFSLISPSFIVEPFVTI